MTHQLRKLDSLDWHGLNSSLTELQHSFGPFDYYCLMLWWDADFGYRHGKVVISAGTDPQPFEREFRTDDVMSTDLVMAACAMLGTAAHQYLHPTLFPE